MNEHFDPVVLRYEGLDADDSLVDLGQIGLSLQGAAKVLGSAGSLVVTGQYARRAPALSVRVLAGTAKRGTWEIPAVIVSVIPLAAPMLPAIADHTQKLATKAVTGIFNYVVSSLGRKPSEAAMAFELAEKALSEMGQTSRAAMRHVERIAANQRPAVKLFLSPIGESCTSVRVGEETDGAVRIDAEVRAAVEAQTGLELGPTSVFSIFISELDLKNKSCKFSLRDDEDPDRRILGEITDPTILQPGNPYSRALAAQTWIQVAGKPELRDGEIERLYIADVVTSPPLIAAA